MQKINQWNMYRIKDNWLMPLILCFNHTDERKALLSLHYFPLLKRPLYLFFEQEKPTHPPFKAQAHHKCHASLAKLFLLLEMGLVIPSPLCSYHIVYMSLKGTHLPFLFLKDKCCVIIFSTGVQHSSSSYLLSSAAVGSSQ